MEGSLKHKTASGIFWGIINNGSQQLISVLVGLILLSNLAPGDYGLVGMLAIFSGLATILQEGGFISALTNRKGNSPDDYNSVFWLTSAISVTLYLILFFAAPAIARFFGHSELVLVARILFISFIFNGLTISQNAYFFSNMLIKETARIDVFATLVAGIAAVAFALCGLGYWALVANSVIVSLLRNLLRWIKCPWKPSLKINMAPACEMLGFSIFLVFGNILNQVQANLFSVILGKAYTKQDVGYYMQGNKWSAMVANVISGSVSMVAQPIFAKTVDDVERQRAMLAKTVRLSAFLSFPCLLGLALIAENFVMLLNADFAPSIPILQMYCIFNVATPIFYIFNGLLLANGDARRQVLALLIHAVLQVASVLVLYRFSIYWVAFGAMAVNIAMMMLYPLFTHRYISYSTWNLLLDMAPYAVIAAVSMVVSYFATLSIGNHILAMCVKIAIACPLYFALLYLCGSKLFSEAISFLKQRRAE